MLESRDVSELFPSTLTAPLGCTPNSLKYSTIQLQLQLLLPLLTHLTTGVNPAGDAEDTSPIFWLGGRQREYPSHYYYVLSDIADQY